MVEQRRRHARVEQHRIGPGLDPARIEPRHRPLPGALADLAGIVEVLEIADAVPGMVALHRRALAGDHAGERAVAARAIGAGEAARGRQRDDLCAGRRAGAGRIADSRDSERRGFGRQRAFAQSVGPDFGEVAELETRHLALEQVRRGEARKRVFGRLARHRHAALDQLRQRFVAEIGRGDAGRARAVEQAQGDALAFGVADLLERAEAHLDGGRAVARIDGVDRGRAGGERAVDERLGRWKARPAVRAWAGA